MIQPGGFLSGLLGLLLKAGLPLMKNIIKPLAKKVFLAAAASAADAGIHKNILGSGTTTLIMSNDEMEDIVKIVKSLEDSGLSLKGVCETIQNKKTNKFRSIFLGTLGASLLGNILADKGMNRAEEGFIRAA